MDIFNRKKLAELEKEMERRETIHEREINEVRKEVAKYKEQLDEVRFHKIEKEKECARLKEENEEYERTAKNDKQTIEIYIQQLNELKNKKREKADKKDIYHISDTVTQKPEYISAIYKSAKSLFTSYEHELFKLLCEVVSEIEREKSVKLTILSKLRLADIINLWQEDYNNPSDEQHSFIHRKKEFQYKQKVYEEIKKIKPDFDNDDYKEAFLYPLSKRHLDFVICSTDEVLPFLAIELHGDEHNEELLKTEKDEQKSKPIRKTIYSDKLKKALLDAIKYETKVDLLIIKNEDLTDTQSVKNIVLGRICECLARLNA